MFFSDSLSLVTSFEILVLKLKLKTECVFPLDISSSLSSSETLREVCLVPGIEESCGNCNNYKEEFSYKFNFI